MKILPACYCRWSHTCVCKLSQLTSDDNFLLAAEKQAKDQQHPALMHVFNPDSGRRRFRFFLYVNASSVCASTSALLCVWHVMAICRLAVVKLMTPFFKPQRDDDIFLHDVLQREAVRHFNSPTDPLAAMATVSRSTWTMPALTRGVFLLLVSRWFRTCWITWCECWAWKSQRGFQMMFGTI